MLNKLQLLDSEEGKHSLIARQMRKAQRQRKRGGLSTRSHYTTVTSTTSRAGLSTRRMRRASTFSLFDAEIRAARRLETAASSPVAADLAEQPKCVTFHAGAAPDRVKGLRVNTHASREAGKMGVSVDNSGNTSRVTQGLSGPGSMLSKVTSSPALVQQRQPIYTASAGSLAAQVHSHRLVHHFRASRRAVEVRNCCLLLLVLLLLQSCLFCVECTCRSCACGLTNSLFHVVRGTVGGVRLVACGNQLERSPMDASCFRPPHTIVSMMCSWQIKVHGA